MEQVTVTSTKEYKITGQMTVLTNETGIDKIGQMEIASVERVAHQLEN